MNRLLTSCVVTLICLMLCCYAGAAPDALVFKPAIPVPGLEPNPNYRTEDFNWISSHADFMYVTLGGYPNRTIAGRSWNSVTEEWSAPVEIGIGPEASGAWPSPDGNTLYYYTGSVGHIYRSQNDGTGWSAGEIVPNVNTQYGGASPVFNGQQLFIMTFFEFGNLDIGVSQYDADTDDFTASLPVTELNSPYTDIVTWVSSDGDSMIFSSNRPGGYGSSDLYSATWDQQLGQWGDITNLGPSINTVADECSGRVAADAGLFFFERRPSASEWYLMQSEIVPEPATLSLLALGGLIFCRK